MRRTWLVFSTSACAAILYSSWGHVATAPPLAFIGLIVVPCVVIVSMPWMLDIWKE